MNLKAAILFGSFLLSTQAMSAVVRSHDVVHRCDLFRVTTEKTPILPFEKIVITKEVYGLALENMDIDFDQREVRVNLIANVVMGLNRTIVNEKLKIDESNTDFKNLTNQLNRKLSLLEKACVDSSNTLIYASVFPQEK